MSCAGEIYAARLEAPTKDLYNTVGDWLRENVADPRVQALMRSENKILECGPGVITLSQEDEFTDSDGVYYKFDRASFIDEDKMLWYCYKSEDGASYTDGDGEHFSDIRVEIDNDFSLHVYFGDGKGTHERDPITGADVPVHTIPYLNANAHEVAQLVTELKRMGVLVTTVPDSGMNSIRDVLANVRAFRQAFEADDSPNPNPDHP